MNDRRDRVLAALRNDVNLLFAVCVILRNEKVAGPWMADVGGDHTKRVRRGADGKTLAVVKRHGTRNFNPWEASTVKSGDDEERPSKNFMTQGEALDWCDAQLLSMGYQLGNGEG